ncbi:hypothetical protein K432DRAFT_287810 [Lepidopterella palustris CBS 459.81]|uniref:Defect at low temperature protein 1 n=1 Tax=Lepidopterella palustris CBS 459.81 TaxID=1314670 RepID=A0A8E2EJH8_9PEZI|nr:hypothetical protein K432DRAFT_287810 [Lepidopterella palustris CBS 459.81]
MRIHLFRIWYSTTYSVLFFILIILLGISPADTIYQSFKNNQIQNTFVIAGVYLLTFILTVLIYSTRIYTNRSVLAGIPKAYIPVENGEVGKAVRRMIVKSLKRSAIIAWDSNPRDIREEIQSDGRTGTRPCTAERNRSTFRRRNHLDDVTIIPVSASSPPWGHIAHPGWASPASEDLPNLHFWAVIPELPNLIEAKAVSLAPPDPALDIQLPAQDNSPILPDAQVVALLQRPATMGLRDYLGRLSSFGLINPPVLGAKFLSLYEYARFSTSALTETEFRDLMSIFAEILSGMTGLDLDLLAEFQAEDADSETQSLAPSVSASSSNGSAIHYPRPRVIMKTSIFDGYTFSRRSSSRRTRSESPEPISRESSRGRNISSASLALPRRTASGTSLYADSGPTRRRNPSSGPSSASSLRSARSVIRLTPNPEPGDLPYQYYFDGSG